MFLFRINKIRITDNRKTAFPLLGHDRIEVQLMSFVTTGNLDLPDLHEFIQSADATRKKEILAACVQSVAASRILTPIANVTDNFTATFGDAGFSLYDSQNIPDEINWEFIALRIRDETRHLGDQLTDVIHDKDFDTFGNNLSKVLTGAVNPIFTAGVEIGKFVLSFVAKKLQTTPDNQIGLFYMTLSRQEDYPHGERKRDNIPDLTGNMHVDYSLLGN